MKDAGPYGADLAAVHDAGFTGFAREAGPGVIALLRERGIEEGLVVELGCGSGVFARQVLDAGYDLFGYDLSPAMVRLARRAAPGGTFRAASFVDAELPECDAVVAMGEVVNYLFDVRHARRGLARLFRRVHRALRPGGALVFDAATPGRARAKPPRSFAEGDGWATLVEALEDQRAKTLERRVTTFRRVGRTYRRTHEVHRLRLYPRAEVLSALRSAGFRARTLRSYGERALWPGHAAYLAWR